MKWQILTSLLPSFIPRTSALAVEYHLIGVNAFPCTASSLAVLSSYPHLFLHFPPTFQDFVHIGKLLIHLVCFLQDSFSIRFFFKKKKDFFHNFNL